MQPSKYQTAFFDFVEHGTGNAFVDAKAGSGKTTTIVASLCRISSHGAGDFVQRSIHFLAFNKAIAVSLKPRVPAHVRCSTIHSLGYSALRQVLNLSRDAVKSDKCRKMVWNAVDRDNPDMQQIIKLVSLAKNLGIGILSEIDDKSVWHAMIRDYDLQIENPDAAVRVGQSVLRASNAKRDVIDFDDMIYLPLLLNASFSPLDFIFVDEAQDLNAIQIEVIARCRHNETRCFFVGDPAQAIYGFRGAGKHVIQDVIERFRCTILPLSVCYRCGTAIISEAQKLVPSIEAWEESPVGSVRTLVEYRPETFKPGAAILCRCVAPLVSFAFALLRHDVPCTIVGRDIGAQIKKLIERMRATNLEDLKGKLDVWRDRELAVCDKEGSSPEWVYDQYSCVMFFANGLDEDSRSITSLIAKVDLMFTETASSSKVSLSSMHKAKGMEWDTVFILDRELCPSKWAKLPWQQEQEKNLQYVATTRPKLELFYIKSASWDEKEVLG